MTSDYSYIFTLILYMILSNNKGYTLKPFLEVFVHFFNFSSSVYFSS